MKITGSLMQQQWLYDLIMWDIIFSHWVCLKTSTSIPCPVDRDDIVSLSFTFSTPPPTPTSNGSEVDPERKQFNSFTNPPATNGVLTGKLSKGTNLNEQSVNKTGF